MGILSIRNYQGMIACVLLGLLLIASVSSHSSLPLGYPTDCRNVTWNLHGEKGPLRVMSWHIHYNTNVSEFGRFYDMFIAHYRNHFSPTGVVKCPFGFNAGEPSHEYFCSLDDPPHIKH